MNFDTHEVIKVALSKSVTERFKKYGTKQKLIFFTYEINLNCDDNIIR